MSGIIQASKNTASNLWRHKLRTVSTTGTVIAVALIIISLIATAGGIPGMTGSVLAGVLLVSGGTLLALSFLGLSKSFLCQTKTNAINQLTTQTHNEEAIDPEAQLLEVCSEEEMQTFMNLEAAYEAAGRATETGCIGKSNYQVIRVRARTDGVTTILLIGINLTTPTQTYWRQYTLNKDVWKCHLLQRSNEIDLKRRSFAHHPSWGKEAQAEVANSLKVDLDHIREAKQQEKS